MKAPITWKEQHGVDVAAAIPGHDVVRMSAFRGLRARWHDRSILRNCHPYGNQ